MNETCLNRRFDKRPVSLGADKTSCKNRRGFTLIELLVVISIISLLMSIMLPGLSRSREIAQRVVCASNMRQLTLAWMTYANYNDGEICSADTDWNDGGKSNWIVNGDLVPGNTLGNTKESIMNGALWPYTYTTELYKCKTDKSKLLCSFSLSRTMNGKTCNCEHDNIDAYKKLSQIRRTSKKMVFIDAASRDRWIEGSFCPVADITAVPPQWFVRDSRNITSRHADGCNISYADSHCGYRRWKNKRTVDLANFQISPENASDENDDLLFITNSLKGRYQ